MQTYIYLLCNVFCQNPRSDWFKFVNVCELRPDGLKATSKSIKCSAIFLNQVKKPLYLLSKRFVALHHVCYERNAAHKPVHNYLVCNRTDQAINYIKNTFSSEVYE